MPRTEPFDFQVRRNDLSATRVVDASTRPDDPLEPGEALLRIDRFALSSNNITYGLVGDLMNYWNFFPAPDGWGRIPVWGFADVVQSRAEGVREGERVFGYLPISSYLRVRPARVDAEAFMDGVEHRRALPPVYQRYVRAPRSDRRQEDLRCVLSPLLGTGFLVDDWLAGEAFFGARQMIFASASSKTALGTAFHLHRRAPREYQVIGLTSARNRAFCERVGYYDRVLEYGELAGLPATTPSVFIDMAADPKVLTAVHTHLGEALRHSCLVGMTHRPESLAPPEALPGPAPQLFFAPGVGEKRVKELGQAGFNALREAAEGAATQSVSQWLELVQGSGRDAIESTYRKVLEGQAKPEQGFILSPSG